MSRPVVLSVNGRNGSDITDERQVELGRELIRRAAASINGAHGADAYPAHRGEPAGTLSVELEQSPNFPEGFIVRTRMQVPENRNPAVTEILPQKDVVFEAVGGNGEAGARGFDGQSGMDGTAGQDATNVQDATAGTPGGNGGNAGAGTNGGDGGNGGQVRVYVDEDKTHLLLATSWEVWGGKGGIAGKHGTPGPGGKGGKGGRNFKWKEQNGYQYKCTENCEGRTTAPASSLHSITKRDPRLLLLQGINQQVSAGSNFQTTVARIAQYRPNIIRDTTGLCECSGGNGHCTGCATLPIYQDRTRVEGDDGPDGQRGEKPIVPLFSGRDGRPGEVLIIVRPRTAGGVEKRYSSRYQLELVNFELEDENSDGIFEPGEHLFVRRIRVRNSGGMPSPTRETRVEFGTSEYLQSIPGSEGVTYIPSIPAGQTVTLPGSIKVLIRESEMSINRGQPFKVVTTIALKATMPGLNRRLDHFDFERPVEIQYPLELQEIDHLASVATGSENRISLKVRNQSSQPFGANRASLRRAEVKISIASEAGSLLSASGIWSQEIFQTTKEVPVRSTVDMFQTFKISHRAKDHSYTTVHVQFFISSPGPVPPSGRSLGELGIPMRLTQSFDLKLQISAGHAFDEEAAVLVVTNVKTPPGRFEAIGDFIRKELHLKMDVWNVSQYGGLSPQDQNKEHEENTLNILEEYRGRTIMFLGNSFEHFGLKEQTMMDLCESDVVGKESFAGSTFLLLGSTTGKSEKETWLKHSVFPVAYRISDITTKVKESATFQTRCALSQSISEQRISGTATSQAYKIESQPKWFYGGPKRSVKRHSKQVQSYLRSNLPQERFWVCPVYPRIDGGRNHSGYIAVWHGLPLSRKIRATESKQLLEERNKPPMLHPFDSFNIICSLPYSLRLDILGSFERDSTAGAGETEDDEGSTASKDGMKYSDRILDAVQYSLEEDISYEIENFLGPSPTFENNSLGESAKPWNSFIIHFPCLDTILRKLEMADGAPPAVLEVLRMAIASTNPQTVVQVARSITFPIGDRRAQLKSYLTRRIDMILVGKGYDPESLKEFRITTEAKHSRFNSNKRDTKKLIEERNRQFVKVPTNEYRKGRLTTEDLVKETELCTQSEWDARCSEFEKTKVALKKSVTRAMTQRGKMSTLKSRTVGEPFSVAEDLG